MVNQLLPEINVFGDDLDGYPRCETLAQVRSERGLSQLKLGAAADIPSQRISNLENGKDRPLTKSVAEKLSEALSLKPCELFPEYYWRQSTEYIELLENAITAVWRERSALSGGAVFAIQKVQEFTENKRIIVPQIGDSHRLTSSP